MTQPKLFECQFITLSEILDSEEYEKVSLILDNDFTWGDSEMVLVSQKDIKSVFDSKATWARREVDEMNAVQKVRDAMEAVGDSVYVNLY